MAQEVRTRLLSARTEQSRSQVDEQLCYVLHNIGRWQKNLKHYAEAERAYQQALQIYIEFNDCYQQAGIFHQLGRVAQEQRQYEQALEYYQQALQALIFSLTIVACNP